MPEAILKLSGISKAFSGVQALDDVSIELHKGGIHCLIGENGSGKSTLVKVISGVYRPDCGSIEINGKAYDHMTPMESTQNGIQIIYQDFSLFPNLKVFENIAINSELFAKRKLINNKRMRKLAAEALESIGVQIDLDERVENLSVANKQLVAIARALLHDAKLIIMDEPTTALTKKEVSALFKIIRKLQAQGVSILFISHKMDEVFEISQDFTIIRSGKKIIDGKTADFDADKFVYYMTGRSIDEVKFTAPEADMEAQPVLEVKDLCLSRVFKDVSFAIHPGEILGITGLLGSGRTELALSLYGVHPATSGSIRLNGHEIKVRSIQEAGKYGISYLPEDRLTEGLCLPQSIFRNIHLSTLGNYTRRGILQNDNMQTAADGWVKIFSIATKNTDNAVATLSGGNQQKVVLSRLMAMEPKVLILNGPTVGVDIGAKFDIHAELRKIAASGVALIIISDDIREVYMNCNRILVMKQGRISNHLRNDQTSIEELSALMVE